MSSTQALKEALARKKLTNVRQDLSFLRCSPRLLLMTNDDQLFTFLSAGRVSFTNVVRLQTPVFRDLQKFQQYAITYHLSSDPSPEDFSVLFLSRPLITSRCAYGSAYGFPLMFIAVLLWCLDKMWP